MPSESKRPAQQSCLACISIAISWALVATLLFYCIYNVLKPLPLIEMPSWHMDSKPESGGTGVLETQRGGYLRLKSLGFNPSVALDIGGNNGNWGSLLKDVYGTKTFLIGNDDKLCTYGFPYVIVEIEKIKQGRRRNFAGSSHPKEGDAVSSYQIDDLARFIPRPNIIRFNATIDSLDILAGAVESLKYAQVIIVNTRVLDGHVNSITKPLKILTFLNTLGFQLLDIMEFLKFMTPKYERAMNEVSLVLVQKNSSLIDALNIKVLS
jgi:hypothetical protein